MSMRYPLAIIDTASITTQVKMRLIFRDKVSAFHTRVKTNHGVVTLEGKALNAAERDLVTQLASGVSGVRCVENHMVIEEVKSH